MDIPMNFPLLFPFSFPFHRLIPIDIDLFTLSFFHLIFNPSFFLPTSNVYPLFYFLSFICKILKKSKITLLYYISVTPAIISKKSVSPSDY